MSDPEEALQGLRFTLSHPVTNALLAGSELGHKLGITLAAKFAAQTT